MFDDDLAAAFESRDGLTVKTSAVLALTDLARRFSDYWLTPADECGLSWGGKGSHWAVQHCFAVTVKYVDNFAFPCYRHLVPRLCS